MTDENTDWGLSASATDALPVPMKHPCRDCGTDVEICSGGCEPAAAAVWRALAANPKAWVSGEDAPAAPGEG